MPVWTAIIPTYGKEGVSLTSDCIRSLWRSTEKNEIIVVDDGSDSECQAALEEMVEEYGITSLVLRSENGGFAKAINDGLELANGQVVILVNNDTQAIGKTADDLANFTLFSGGGAVGCKLLYADKSVQHAGITYVPGDYFDHIGRGEQRYAPYVCRIRRSLCTGAMLAINRAALDTIGFLDTRYGMAFEDVDYQMRCLETGFQVFYCGIIEAYHLEGKTRGRTPQEKALHGDWTEAENKARELFFERWQGINFAQFQYGGG
jgi:GT2 family glycosyltransferase